MTSIPQVAQALTTVLTERANAAARSTGFIKRQRAFSGAQFVQTLVFGWLAQPQASYQDLVETATELGVSITPQGLAERLTLSAADCLLAVLQSAISQVVTADPVALPLLDRFSAVYIQDSTTITLPNALAEVWQGCGGSHGRVAAALKGQVRLELRTGQLEGPLLQDGRASDKSIAFANRPARGSITIRDLGYFHLPDLARAAKDQRYWLTRLYPGTAVFTLDGERHELLELLAEHGSEGDVLERPVRIGVEQRIACRLLAVRVPADVEAQRRERLLREAKKKGRSVSAASLAVCGWTVVVTNVAAEMLTLWEAMVLMRLRWQIELLFKLWKSDGQLDASRRERGTAVLCEVYAKLIGLIIQHWVILTSCWDMVERSIPKAARAFRRSVHRLLRAMGQQEQMVEVLRAIGRAIVRVARQTPRRKQPNAYQLLLDPSLIHKSLT